MSFFTRVRTVAWAFLAHGFVSVALAQTPPAVPDARPPSVPIAAEDELEPQVTIRQREGATVEEYRLNGRLYKVKVIPTHGVPYFLIDPKGDGNFVAQETPGSSGLSVPQWVIGTF